MISLFTCRGLRAQDQTRPENQKVFTTQESGAITTTTEEDYSVDSQMRHELIYPSNYGHPGIFRVRSAEALPLGAISFGIGGEFYSTSRGPSFPGISGGNEANTIAEHIFLGFSPVERLTLGISRISSSTTFGQPPQLISSLGDFDFSLSYSFPITLSFAVAPIVDVLIASNFNSLSPSGNTVSAGFGLVGTLSLYPTLGIPLYAHLNVIYHMPQVRGGTPSVPLPETFFRFSRYDTITTTLGGELKLGNFFPFVELRQSVQAGTRLGFDEQPSTLTLGARITPLSNKSFAVLLGGDIGMGRGGDRGNGFGLVPGVPYSPQWQVLGQLSYTVGVSQTERKHYVTTADVNVVDRKFIIQKSIAFKIGSAELEPISFPVLDQIAQVVKDNKIKKMLIVGHTDSSHNEDYNLKLSLDRANTVKRYLATKEIAEESMLTQGYGKRKPRASNATEEGRSLNRRVEFYIID